MLLGDFRLKINLTDNRGNTPLDTILCSIINNKENYIYVKLWDELVTKGVILNKQKTAYQNLTPSQFKEPQKSYIQLIKQNPPKHSTNN